MGLSQNRCDVLVIGGGPAGLAAAIAMRQRGIDVLVADALLPPIDKACGEGIMPDSRRELEQLGVNLSSAHGAPLRGIRFCDGHSTITAGFSTGEGIGLRRVVLHSLLVDRAREVGVRMRWGTQVALNPGRPPTLAGNLIQYRYLVGADGQSSRVRSWARLNRGTLHTRRFGFRVHFRTAPWSPHVEVHWGPFGQAYVTPVGSDEICVAVVTRFPGMARTAQVIDSLPTLREKLRNAQITSRERGSITTTRTLHRVVRGNIALLGDASGSADAITGEGLAMAFRQALLLAASVENGSLSPYAVGHRSTLRIPQSMARSLLIMDRLPSIRHKALRVLAREPFLFEQLLRVHMGEEPLRRFLFEHAARFGFRMLLPSPA
jgi:2-polyprenyl-6-methoxyphenol hydroxylase-like FAD-dependent oxidoreductase